MRKFAVLIPTHGRAKKVETIKLLQRSGYTGDLYIVIDDEDEQEQDYRDLYGERVIQFSKQKYIDKTDSMNPQKPRNVVVYARNAMWDIAKELGLTHFLVLDDDYNQFEWRVGVDGHLKTYPIKDLDKVCAAFCDFLDTSGALTVAMAQDGEYIGGLDGAFKKRILRKAMNSFFCRTDRPFQFMGALNEDVNAYVTLGNRGNLFFTITACTIHQGLTQQHAGGLTEAYLDSGTYVKSFYSVMLSPSCVKIKEMGNKYRRIHHMIKWRYAVPKIISDKWKKGAGRDGKTAEGN